MPVYKKSNGTWYARINYTDEFGNYKTKSKGYFNLKREAMDAEAQLLLNLNNKVIRSSSDVTFGYIYDEFLKYKKENVKTSTCLTYPPMWAYCGTLKDIKIERLTVPQYRAFKEELNGLDLSVSRKNKIHCFVRQLVEYATEFYDVRCDVVAKVGGFKDTDKIRTKNVDFYTFDEFKKFIANVDDPVYHCLFMVLYYQGTRIGEANALTWEDIDFDKHTMTINKTANCKIPGVPFLVTSTKKTASDRVLPLEEETERELSQLYSTFKAYTNFRDDWFCFGGPRPLGESWIHTIKDKAAAAGGVKKIRIHDFRHSCASFLIDIGCQPMVVQRYLGHASLKITMDTYSHMYPNQLVAAQDLIKAFKS